MWVVARGTQTVVDVLTDILWLADTKIIGGLALPAEPLIRAEKSLNILLEFIKRTEVKQICFCGHSLGGAISGAIYYLYNIQEMNPVNTKLITINSPHILKSVPEFVVNGDKKIEMSNITKNIHNIVQRVDFIPRSVAPNSLPNYIFEIPGIGSKLKDLEKYFHEKGSPRHGFECVGTYYSLNPSHKGRTSINFNLVDGSKLLNAFSSDPKYLSVALAIDHSSDTVSNCLMELCPSYKNKFNWGKDGRKINGMAITIPEKYKKKIIKKDNNIRVGETSPTKNNSNKNSSPDNSIQSKLENKVDSAKQTLGLLYCLFKCCCCCCVGSGSSKNVIMPMKA